MNPLLLAGPTATGKSAAALVLAERIGGEIISVDSMQVYRGLDIGTGKPTPAERARIPHHLIDVLNLDEPFSAARFGALARQAAQDIERRGRRPIFCGGTGLYFKAWLEGLGEAPPANPALRAQLDATPVPDLLRELAERDPVTFDRIDRANPRRVVRALEVIRLTGRPYSTQRADWSRAPLSSPDSRFTVLALVRQPEDLRSRICARVDAMFTAGLVEETRSRLGAGLGQNRTALQAIGYRQVAEHLRGERGLPETVAEVKRKTWQFAKRQATWLRHQLPVRWVEVAPGEPPEAVADRLIAVEGS